MARPISTSQRQWLVTITGIPGYFMTKQGGEISSDVNKLFPGGTKDPEIVTSPPVTANIVVSRPYNTDDISTLIDLRKVVGGIRTYSITVVATDRDLVAIPATQQVYAGAVLVRVGEPNFDANSGEPSVLELEFAVSNPA